MGENLPSGKQLQSLPECRYWERREGAVECVLCPWRCRIAPDSVGRCGVRRNVDGTLRSLNYARVTSIALDPIEKKPLYHFHPGAEILSLGTFGCNLTCSFCQNWSTSRGRPPTKAISPQAAVDAALQAAERGANIGLAYTYNEPFIWYEYVQDTAALARQAGLKNVLVTNGIVEEAPLRELLPLIDAMNVDIKAWSEEFYRELCGGEGWPARRTVEIARAAGCHVEITTLIIPGCNDRDEELDRIFEWAASVDRRLPAHLSRYHAAHRLEAPDTPASTLRRAWELARKRLDFVYVGNIHIEGTMDTRCPQCGTVAVDREGMWSTQSRLKGGRCAGCGEDLGVVV